MEQYVSKSALVTEIEKLISNGKFKCQQSKENNDQVSYIAWSEHIATCGKILALINTLEVKEVDLEKEIKKYIKDNICGYCVPGVEETAKHFFELGMAASNKAQKGE